MIREVKKNILIYRIIVNSGSSTIVIIKKTIFWLLNKQQRHDSACSIEHNIGTKTK